MKKLERRPVLFQGKSVGLDVHQSTTVYSVLDNEGEEIAKASVPSTRAGLETLLDRIGGVEDVQFALEASGSSLWVYDFLVSHADEEDVHVAQSNVIRPIINSQEKNDENDAWWLAFFLWQGRLPTTYVAEGEVRELRIATRELSRLIEERSQMVCRFRSHLRQEGIQVPANFQTKKTRAAVPEAIEETSGARREALQRLLARIEAADAEIAHWEEMVEEMCKDLQIVQTMIEHIPGLGIRTAPVIYAEMGDPRRFRSAKAFAKATGLPPGYRESGGKISSTGITREGSAAARWAFTRAVIACLRCQHSAGWAIKQWILARVRRQPKKKAYVATARKLSEGVWRLFAFGEEFDLAKAFPAKKAG